MDQGIAHVCKSNAKFPIDTSNLAGVSASDLEIIGKASQIGESAETSAFDPAIDAAGGADVATALQNGKIKNKVLKREHNLNGRPHAS